MNRKTFLGMIILAAAFMTNGLVAAEPAPSKDKPAAQQSLMPDAEVKQLNEQIEQLLREKKNEEAAALQEKIFRSEKYPAAVRANVFQAWATAKYKVNKRNKELISKLYNEGEKYLKDGLVAKAELHSFVSFMISLQQGLGYDGEKVNNLRMYVINEPEANSNWRGIFSKQTMQYLIDADREVEAEKLLRKLLAEKSYNEKNPPLGPTEQLATLLALTFRLDQGLALLDDFEKTYPNYPHIKIWIAKQKASLYAMYLEKEKACAVLTAVGLPASGAKYLYSKECRALFKKLVADEKLDIAERRIAYKGLLEDHPGNMEILRKYRNMYIDTGDLRARNSFLRDILTPVPLATAYGNYQFVLDLEDLVKDFPEIAETYDNVFHRVYCLYGVRKYQEAAALAAKYKDNAKYKPDQRMKLAIMAEFNSPDFATAYEKVLKDFPISTDLKVTQRGQELLDCASYAMVGEKEKEAQQLYDTYEKMFVPEPKKVYEIKFYDDPMYNLTNYLESGSKPKMEFLDRKFGGNMEYLFTDVSTGNRGEGIGSEKDKKIEYTRFSALCDEYALRMIFEIPTNDPAGMLGKLDGNGSFEMYLAPGTNQPYYCLLGEVNEKFTPVWQTTYNTPNHHRIRENTNDIENDINLGEKSFYKMISLSWRSFYSKLPEAGECWEFESMHWSKAGGYGWNGMKDLHARDSWGLLKFSLTEKQLIKIKRHIIMDALHFYQQEKATMRIKDNVSQPGVLYHWKDPLLGDPAFYEAKVRPLQEKLDAYITLVSSSMSDADVEKVYSEAVEYWYNIEFIIADLRRKWMEQSLFRE